MSYPGAVAERGFRSRGGCSFSEGDLKVLGERGGQQGGLGIAGEEEMEIA